MTLEAAVPENIGWAPLMGDQGKKDPKATAQETASAVVIPLEVRNLILDDIKRRKEEEFEALVQQLKVERKLQSV